MQHQILFTSDIHGNKIQYSKLTKFAQKVSPDSILIGGDIAPKNFYHDDFIKGQEKFFQKDFQTIMKKLKQKSPDSQIYLMMGNDDCSCNLDVLKKGEPDLYQIIHNKRIKINKDFEIVGYSNVPITPFGIKDWEKYDLSKVSRKSEAEYSIRKITNYRLHGIISTKLGWKNFNFTPEIGKKDSIQKDLAKKLFTKTPNKTIYVMHSPPDNTHLDQTSNQNHVGSFAIRNFIEKYNPYLTLHGHIHETVDVTGKFKEHIGKTLSLTSGNYNVGKNLAVLVFDLYDMTSSAP